MYWLLSINHAPFQFDHPLTPIYKQDKDNVYCFEVKLDNRPIRTPEKKKLRVSFTLKKNYAKRKIFYYVLLIFSKKKKKIDSNHLLFSSNSFHSLNFPLGFKSFVGSSSSSSLYTKLPTYALALGIAHEWDFQIDVIEPYTMPLVNSLSSHTPLINLILDSWNTIRDSLKDHWFTGFNLFNCLDESVLCCVGEDS